MPWKVKVFSYVEPEPENEVVYQTKVEAQAEADQAEFLQPDEVKTQVVECDETGKEV
jgi:hypothetical protein